MFLTYVVDHPLLHQVLVGLYGSIDHRPSKDGVPLILRIPKSVMFLLL